MYSEKYEDFLDVTVDVLDFLSDNVESNGLGKGSALTYSHDITWSKSESWGAVNSDSVMSLLKSVVLFDIMQVITSNDNGSIHFSWYNDTPNHIIIINKYAKEKQVKSKSTRGTLI